MCRMYARLRAGPGGAGIQTRVMEKAVRLAHKRRRKGGLFVPSYQEPDCSVYAGLCLQLSLIHSLKDLRNLLQLSITQKSLAGSINH